MTSNFWKPAVAALLVSAVLTACGTPDPEGPVFATASSVAAAKPNEFGFKHAIRVRNLEGLDEPIRRNLGVVLRAEDFTQSLRKSLANDQMLAPDNAPAEYEITPVFIELRTAPVNESVTAAQAIFDYRVMRPDGATVFTKRIVSEFSSVADPAFSNSGMFNRTLRVVGLGKPEAPPIVTNRPGMDADRGPGPERAGAREIHAARNAIALNVRNVMRELVARSPERVVAPAPPMKAVTESGAAEGRNEGEAQEAPAPDEDQADTDDPDTDGKPLPPLAPEIEPNG